MRSRLAVYTMRLLQAAARQAARANWSPESLNRDLAEHEMLVCLRENDWMLGWS